MSVIHKPTFKILLFPSKVLANGESPILIRVTYQRQRKYISTGFAGTVETWNDELGLFDRKGGRLSDYEKKANQELKKRAVELEQARQFFNEVQFTFDRFQQKFGKISTPVTVLTYLHEIISELEAANRFGTARCYKDTHNRLRDFRKKNSLSFHDIDLKFLKSFEIHLLRTNKVNSVSIFLRTLRAVFNRAIREGIIKQEVYPFGGFKIKSESTRKRALNKGQLDSLKKFKTDVGSRQYHSLNFFLFSYYARGMNFLDIANLTWDNIQNDRIFYKRKKTGDPIDILIDENLAEIISKYSRSMEYIFPILEKGLSPLTTRNRIKTKLKKTNKDLQAIAKSIGLPDDITFYWARHSFATILKRAGISTTVISETLGHGSEKVTRNYLDSFETNQLDEIGNFL